MLADSEVDSRFRMLVASLNSMVETVDWPGVGEPAADIPDPEHWSPGRVREGIGALRIAAVVVGVATMVVGVVLSRTFDGGILLLIAWLAVIVPAVTLASIFVVDRVRSRS